MHGNPAASVAPMLPQRKEDMMTVVLYGSHGGELDREFVEITDGQEDTTDSAIGEAIVRLSRRCVFHPGDSIVVEATEDLK